MSVLLERNGGDDPGVLVKCLVQWLFADLSCHLHSTDTPEFCEEEDEDDTGGSARVSMTAAVSELEDGEPEDDDKEEEAATVPAQQTRMNMHTGRCKQHTIDFCSVTL